MKKFHLYSIAQAKSLCLLFTFLIVTSSAFAQKIQLNGAQVPSFDASLSNQFSEYQVFQIGTRALASDFQQEENFQLDLRLGDQYHWEINLTPSQIISPNYREIIGTENGPVILPKRKIIAYTGYLQGTELESRLTLDNGWIMGFVTISNGQKIYIEPLGNLQSIVTDNQYIVYSGNAVLNSSNGSCGAIEASSRAPIHEDHSNDPSNDPVQLTNTNCKEVDFSVASSFDMINGFHNSPQLVLNHIISITNMMQTYFEFSSLEYLLNENYVSSSAEADPFDGAVGASTDDLLPGFQSWAQNSGIFSEHDVAQVWTARNITGCGSNFGLIGCAYVNVICNNFRYNICEDWRPTDIQALSVLSAHELGHNWNCVHEDAGAAPLNIMSGTIATSAIGFGPNSMAKILNTADNSSCLSGCDGPPEPPMANCPAQADFPFQEWIEDVTIGTLSNLGSGKFIDFSDAGYSDFTDLESAPNDRADLVEYTFNAGFSGPNPGDFWTAFIDYNQNNIFDLPEEEVIRSQGTSISGSFSIPINAFNGTKILRIILSKDGFSGPCENPAFGEVEDYLFEIGGSIITPPANDPDLTIGNLIVDNQGETETIVGYSIDFSNLGLSTTGAFRLGVILSEDNQLDDDDLFVGEIPTGNFTPGLTVEDVPGSFNLEGVSPGNYFLFFKIDTDEVVTESDETNNILVRNFTVTGETPPTDLADLTISNLTVSSQANVGLIVGYTIDISNIGTITTGDFSLGVFLSEDNQLSGNDLFVGEIPTGNFEPGSTFSDVFGAFNLEGVAPGSYSLIFKVDKDDVETESNENNNILVRNFTVIGDNTGDEIDLELSMSASVTEPDQFSKSRITLTLFNNSSNQATNIVSRFNFSSDYVFAGDGSISISGGGTFSIGNGNWAIPSLSGGQTATVSFDLFTLSGDFNPCAEVASVDQQDVDSTPGNGQCPNAFEDDEANLNSVSPPSETVDIAVTLEVTNETPELFTKIGYQVTVQNLGSETATGVVVDFDYGAQDSPSALALVNNPNPDYNDWEGIWTIGTLAPGEARTFELEVFVLATASPSTTLFAELSELNESDTNFSNDISETTIFINDGATLNEADNPTNANLRRPDLSLDNLFPNPALDKVTLAINNQKETNQVPLQIFDAFGKNIYNKEILLEKRMNFLTINTTEFSEGVYLVVLPDGSHRNLVKRFIKMR